MNKRMVFLIIVVTFVFTGMVTGEIPDATKRVLIEEFTGAWCGYCPDGHVVLDSIIAQHGDRIVPVMIHQGDAMQFNDGIRSVFPPPGYPSAMIDRVLFDGQTREAHYRNLWVANTQQQINTTSPVHVGLVNTYSASTRQLEVTVQAQFTEAVSGDHRFLCYVVENTLSGTGTGWNQSNYYNNTAGHPFYQAGNPIIGYVHHHVLRAVLSGAVGNPGVIPESVVAGQIVRETFTYVLPADIDETNVTLVGAVAHYGTPVGQKYVLNAAQIHMSQTVPAMNVTALLVLLVLMTAALLVVGKRRSLRQHS